jgi:hypothetical protein
LALDVDDVQDTKSARLMDEVKTEQPTSCWGTGVSAIVGGVVGLLLFLALVDPVGIPLFVTIYSGPVGNGVVLVFFFAFCWLPLGFVLGAIAGGLLSRKK